MTTGQPPARDPSHPTPSAHDDRRQHARMYVRRGCKVFDPASRRYIPATTHDFSVGGALVWLEAGRRVQPGDIVDLIVGWGPGVVMRSESAVSGVVLRAIDMAEGRQAVALRFRQSVAQNTRLAA